MVDYNRRLALYLKQQMRVARRYVVRGIVQGVGFRFFTEDAARRAGVHGYVANRNDGTVEVIAEGEATAVERLEASLRCGPPAARVEALEVEEHPPTAAATGFSIRSGGTWTP